MASTGEIGSVLATRLRDRRHELGRTLAAVAAVADVSSGYLSAIENGANVPSLPVLARLAHALDLSLAEVLRTSGSRRVRRGSLATADQAEQLAREGSALCIVHTSAAAGEAGDAPVALTGGDLFLFVLDGRLDVMVDGDTFDVCKGDSLHCDRPQEVTWQAGVAARALWACSA